ncbi:hypothetical protein, partial [Hyphomonas pacifica]|uniref:hypothetical protein n=1 Tax=Hyphomonas pacifica TaxID=1280941 RepID=UPI0019D6C663
QRFEPVTAHHLTRTSIRHFPILAILIAASVAILPDLGGNRKKEILENFLPVLVSWAMSL